MRKVIASTVVVVAGLVLTGWVAASGQTDVASTSTAWDKRVQVNGVVTDADTIPIAVVPGDTVEIVDRVWVTATHDVTFTLVGTWTESLELVSWLGDTGSVTTTAGTLTWNVRDVPPNSWYAITETFAVLGGDWAYGYVTETSTVEGGSQVEDRVLIFARGDVCLPVNVVSLESDTPVALGQAMHFTTTVLGSPPIIYTWDYGDGTPLEFDVGLDTVTHTYGADGTYTVTLNAVNGCPSSDSGSIVVMVNPPPPEPAWDKQVRVNGVLTDTIPIAVIPSDTVEIVDRVWVTYTHDVTFTLVETWTESLDLVSWVGDTGDVIAIAGTLTWDVVSGPPNIWYTITRTFTVLTGDWDTETITGSLWVEYADPPSETWVLRFERRNPDPPPVALIYLPLVLRSYPAYHHIVDAPDTCPGLVIEVGGHLYREDFDHANDNDWYRFTAQAGFTYVIRTFDLGAWADTVLYLYDADCATVLAQNDDVEPNDPASQVEWQAPADGEYHVDIRHYNWTVFGAGTEYTLQVTR